MTGSEAFYALAFRGVTIAAGTIAVRTTGGAFDAHVGVGITDQTFTAVAITKTGDTLIGAQVAASSATLSVCLTAVGFCGFFFTGATGDADHETQGQHA